MEFPGNLESTNLSGDNLSREIGRSSQPLGGLTASRRLRRSDLLSIIIIVMYIIYINIIITISIIVIISLWLYVFLVLSSISICICTLVR